MVELTCSGKICLNIRTFGSVGEPAAFGIHSSCGDKAAFDLHAQMQYTGRFISAAQPLMGRPIERRRSRAISGAMDAGSGRQSSAPNPSVL